jgi:hypothetical protein
MFFFYIYRPPLHFLQKYAKQRDISSSSVMAVLPSAVAFLLLVSFSLTVNIASEFKLRLFLFLVSLK